MSPEPWSPKGTLLARPCFNYSVSIQANVGPPCWFLFLLGFRPFLALLTRQLKSVKKREERERETERGRYLAKGRRSYSNSPQRRGHSLSMWGIRTTSWAIKARRVEFSSHNISPKLPSKSGTCQWPLKHLYCFFLFVIYCQILSLLCKFYKMCDTVWHSMIHLNSHNLVMWFGFDSAETYFSKYQRESLSMYFDDEDVVLDEVHRRLDNTFRDLFGLVWAAFWLLALVFLWIFYDFIYLNSHMCCCFCLLIKKKTSNVFVVFCLFDAYFVSTKAGDFTSPLFLGPVFFCLSFW